MKYFLVVGEASGDLHASHLIKALREVDKEASFVFYGGDLMQEAGGVCLKHYKHTAFMGFIPVLLNLPTIIRNINQCKKDIIAEKPDVVILVDYPGFNLKIAQFVKTHTNIPAFYYILPKIWAWKEYRIKQLKAYIDEFYSILPFEVNYFQERHQVKVNYVGNPTLEEVRTYQRKHIQEKTDKIIALLPGSRLHEIKENLPLMCQAVKEYEQKGFKIKLSCVTNIDKGIYQEIIEPYKLNMMRVNNDAYGLLTEATIALVTSGTATLETALFNVPQVVCYYTPFASVVGWLKKRILKVDYVSLVNLIATKEVVKELVAEKFTKEKLTKEVDALLYDENRKKQIIASYQDVVNKLGEEGCAKKTASLMYLKLKKYEESK